MNTTTRTGLRPILLFGITLTAIDLPLVAFAVSQGLDINQVGQAPIAAQIAIYGQAFMPALAALVASALSGGVRTLDWGFRRVSWSVLLLAWAIPVAGVLFSYGASWLTGAARFDPANLTEATGLPPAAGVLLGLLPGVVPFMVLALGEQIGWSSLLTVRLATTRSRDLTAVIVGIAWSLFHFPLMLFVPGAVPDGVPTPFALAVFTASTIALAFPMVWWRLRTRSIWPLLVFHSSLNAATYFVAQAMTASQGASPWLVGESGVLTVGGLVITVAATSRLWRKTEES
ncbi:CPBP family intramembrane glutamic endopeptidase [Nonomuraea sp. NPDC004354]|uniref:CPBP family intramembrane glutamic endopeptidase n=1 Tax=Nonomuraea sp. NPDC003804 TaxID=3154547 RepID=UPI0033A001AE